MPDLRPTQGILSKVQDVQDMPQGKRALGQYSGYGQIELVGDPYNEYD